MCVSYRLDPKNKAARSIMEAAQKRVGQIQISEGDIYPKSIAPVLCVEERRIVAAPMMWGFPLKGKKSVNFNARAETLNRIPMFRSAKPIVIPCCGFYEWKKGETREKYLFSDPRTELTWIAGVWSDFSDLEDSLFPARFTMVTTEPSSSFSIYHNREPAAVAEDAFRWLETRDSELIRRPPIELTARAV